MKTKFITLSILVSSLISCEKEPFLTQEEQMQYGTTFTVVNNTFGVRDYKVAEIGKYPVAFASLDYGRNLGGGNGYYDTLGFIEFNEDGTGVLQITEQDSIECKASFTYSFERKTINGVEMHINFESAQFRTYLRRKDPPAQIFEYQKAGQDLWVYKVDISKYNGKFIWHANQISN